MKSEQEKLAEPKLSNREVFELARNIANKGSEDEYSGRMNFVGIYEGHKYQVSHNTYNTQLIDKSGIHNQKTEMVSLIGIDFSANLYTRPQTDEISLVEYANPNNRDMADILTNLSPVVEDTENGTEQVKPVHVYRIYEPDRDGDAPTDISVAAETEEEARKKYLEWCEKTNNFHAISMLLDNTEHLIEESFYLPIGLEKQN